MRVSPAGRKRRRIILSWLCMLAFCYGLGWIIVWVMEGEGWNIVLTLSPSLLMLFLAVGLFLDRNQPPLNFKRAHRPPPTRDPSAPPWQRAS